MFDINTLAASDTTFMQFRNGRDELVFDQDGKAVGITFHSPGSAAYQMALDEQQQELIDEGERTGRAKLTARKLRERQNMLLAKATISFDGFDYAAEGKSGVALFLDFWGNPKFGIVREQANSWLGGWRNFLIGSATS